MSEPTYEQVLGGWIGRRDDQRTMLKGSLAQAQHDVAIERFVCARWPLCSHRDADDCGRSQARNLPRWRAETIDGR